MGPRRHLPRATTAHGAAGTHDVLRAKPDPGRATRKEVAITEMETEPDVAEGLVAVTSTPQEEETGATVVQGEVVATTITAPTSGVIETAAVGVTVIVGLVAR